MYSIAEQRELEALAQFLEHPSIDFQFVKPLSQRKQSIKERVYDKYDKGYWILAKNEEGHIHACLALIPNKDEIEISTYAVSETCRGQGIGSTLINKAIEYTQRFYPDCKTLILDSWSGNPAIERIMNKNNFALRESFEDPAKRPPGVKTVVYSRKI